MGRIGGGWEWIIILVIVLLLFGPSRLAGIGKSLGGAISEFRQAMKEDKDKPTSTEEEQQEK